MMKSALMKRIESLESQLESTESDQWQHHIVLCGSGSFDYVRNAATGQRIFDAGFIAQVTSVHKAHASRGSMRFTPIDVQIGPDDETTAAIAEAIQRGVVSSNVQHAANFASIDVSHAAEIVTTNRDQH